MMKRKWAFEHLQVSWQTNLFKSDNATIPTILITEKFPTSRLSSITSDEMDGKPIKDS
jgi:hypothetical protein